MRAKWPASTNTNEESILQPDWTNETKVFLLCNVVPKKPDADGARGVVSSKAMAITRAHAKS